MRLLGILAVFGLLATAVFAAPLPLSVGVGAGDMYGTLGANAEYRVSHQIAATAGLGLNGEADWFIGGRYYLKPMENGPRPRITAGVGTIGATGAATTTHSGFILAVGVTWANETNSYRGWGVDLSTQGDLSFGYQFPVN